MTIEHSLIPQGEQHVTANWVTSTVAALANIAGIGFGDIGKQAWVQGKGHYVLANSDPLIWELVAPTVATVSFVDGTDVLTITLTDATSFTVTIPLGTTVAEANVLIADALTGYYTAAQIDTIVSGIGTALSGKEPTIAAGTASQYWRGDKTWQTLDADAVAETASRVYLSPAQKTVATQAATSLLNGYLSSADWTTFNSKQAALANVITAGAYGSSTQYAIPTFNAKGICTGVTLQTIGAPVLTEANFSVAKTGQPTYTVTWVLTALTDARAWTVPDKAIDFGDLPSVATTNGNTYTGTLGGILGGSNNNVSGTGNLAIGCTHTTLAGSGQVARGLHRYTPTMDYADFRSCVPPSSSAKIKTLQIDAMLQSFGENGGLDNAFLGTYGHGLPPDATNGRIPSRVGVKSVAKVTVDFVMVHANTGQNPNSSFASDGYTTGTRTFSVYWNGTVLTKTTPVAPVADINSYGDTVNFSVQEVTTGYLSFLIIGTSLGQPRYVSANVKALYIYQDT